MTEETSNPEETSTDDAWRNVSQQFKKFGESLAAAFNSTWESEETKKFLEQVKGGLSAAADQLDASIKQALESEEGQRVQAEFGKAAETLRDKGAEAYAEVQPELVTAFRNIRAEIDKIINKMEQSEPVSPPSETTDEDKE